MLHLFVVAASALVSADTQLTWCAEGSTCLLEAFGVVGAGAASSCSGGPHDLPCSSRAHASVCRTSLLESGRRWWVQCT